MVRYHITSLAILIISLLIIGSGVSERRESGALERIGHTNALFVDSFVARLERMKALRLNSAIFRPKSCRIAMHLGLTSSHQQWGTNPTEVGMERDETRLDGP